MIYPFEGKEPTLRESSYIAPTASVIGDVVCAEKSSIWFGAVVRGDEASISIGAFSNIQDNAIVHCDHGVPAVIGAYVTVGHSAVLHSCVVDDCVLIGMGAVILSGVRVGAGSVVAAGAVVKENMMIPPNTLVAGNPAVVKKTLPEDTAENIKRHGQSYARLSEKYKDNGGK